MCLAANSLLAAEKNEKSEKDDKFSWGEYSTDSASDSDDCCGDADSSCGDSSTEASRSPTPSLSRSPVAAAARDILECDIFEMQGEPKTGGFRGHLGKCREELPRHLSAPVVEACLQMAVCIATQGVGRGRPHRGFMIIVGDWDELEDRGSSGFNPFKDNRAFVVDRAGALCKATLQVAQDHAFSADGAVVVDGTTGRIMASNWFVHDLSAAGGGRGGGRAMAARAVALQAGGCYVIACSATDAGDLDLHLQWHHQRVRVASPPRK